MQSLLNKQPSPEISRNFKQKSNKKRNRKNDKSDKENEKSGHHRGKRMKISSQAFIDLDLDFDSDM